MTRARCAVLRVLLFRPPSDAGDERKRRGCRDDADTLIVFEVEQMRIPETMTSACAESAQAIT
jgi:hypothetical protein